MIQCNYTCFFFFFQAEDGIRFLTVTGVQTCALPISTGKPSLAGPAEATALGNIAIQILATGDASSLQEVRAVVDRSFPTEVFEPLETDKWERQTERFEQYCEITYA